MCMACPCPGAEEYLWYKVPKRIDVAILRGTTADVDGNVTFEKEAMLADSLNQVPQTTSTLTVPASAIWGQVCCRVHCRVER